MKSLQALDIEGASYSLLLVIYDASVLQLELQSTTKDIRTTKIMLNKNVIRYMEYNFLESEIGSQSNA